jgi:hypothetical protein
LSQQIGTLAWGSEVYCLIAGYSFRKTGNPLIQGNKLAANVCIIIVFPLFKIEISFKFPSNLD